MLRSAALSATILATLAIAMPVNATGDASPSPGGGSPSPGVAGASTAFADALDRVPDTDEARGSIVSYVDYRTVESARPGAAQPESFAALEALRDAEDPSGRLWNAAYLGVSSGSGDLLRSLFRGAPDWPALIGFDFFDVDREVAFGDPPADGIVLFGEFEPSAIAAAFAARGYTATETDGRSLLCPPDGCDSGTRLHMDQRDPRIPFGGDLGRLEPLGVSETEIDSSASDETVRDLLAAAAGTIPSLGEDPAHRAAAEAVALENSVIPATIVPASHVAADVAGVLLQGGDKGKALLERLGATFLEIPAY
jgi:hypothetical protein